MSRLSATLENGMGWVCRQMAAIGLLALMIISACTVVDAVLRRFFGSSIDGLSDVLEWCMVVAVSACFPAMLWGRHAITVRVLGTLLPWRAREALELIGDTLLAAVMIVIAWQLSIYAHEMWAFGDVTPLKGWPRWPMWAMACIIWYFAVLVQLSITFRQLQRTCARHEPKPLEVQESI